MDKNDRKSGSTRREFIKKTSAAAAAVAAVNIFKTPVYGANTAPSVNVAGANNRLVVGYIGVGNQGMTHVRSQKTDAGLNNIALVAACDLSKTRREEAGIHRRRLR